MKIKEVIKYLESLAPLSSSESYDNSGLIIGNEDDEIKEVLICLDCIESIVDEAIDRGCNLIISHHPIIFSGVKKINGNNYIERTIIKAIKNDIAIYAIHTNLDNYHLGVNKEIGELLKLSDLQILEPKQNVLSKIVCFCPTKNQKDVLNAMFNSGAGNIGKYSNCSFRSAGVGTFLPHSDAKPYKGKINELSSLEEEKIEVLVSNHKIPSVIKAMEDVHPYEEVAYDIIPISNINQNEGSGMIGLLSKPVELFDFLKMVKKTFNCGVIKYTKSTGKKILKVAFCGGSGSFLLKKAKKEGADIFITSDFKYHQFFDAEGEIIIADIGHFESEQYTSILLKGILKKKFTKFAFFISEINTNPINYF
ncbi:MAG: Nif3-like dinuclear metal center hexameric protein [Crocinitomicaceae bacterium]|nr:Nif3-like dinuclear metal center hexameric protein [Crocinitomicaceae bacterium]|tara:strand:- start:21409 stop:22503 length:1095 start_codon:yes stop_codon:yes gene_type:complete